MIVEQLDIVGTCALYVSVTIVNPSPVDPTEYTFRNETINVTRRTLFVKINAKKVKYFVCNQIYLVMHFLPYSLSTLLSEGLLRFLIASE